MQNHRQLRVWRKAHDLALEIRRVAGTFPRAGYGDLRSQMIRAAESVVTNIVEGCGAATSREFGRFLDISIKSTAELEEQLELAFDNGAIDRDTYHRLSTEVVDTRRMLFGLRKRVLSGPVPASK